MEPSEADRFLGPPKDVIERQCPECFENGQHHQNTSYITGERKKEPFIGLYFRYCEVCGCVYAVTLGRNPVSRVFRSGDPRLREIPPRSEGKFNTIMRMVDKAKNDIEEIEKAYIRK